MSRRRSLLALFGTLVVVLLGAGVATVYLVRDALINDADGRLNGTLKLTSSVLEGFDIEQLTLLETQDRPDAIAVVDSAGITAFFVPAGPRSDRLPAPDVSAASLPGRVGDRFTVSAVDGSGEYRVGVDALSGNRVLMVAQPLDGVDSTLTRLSVALILTLVGVVGLLGIVVWFLMRSSLRPYDEMIATAEAIVEGDMGRRAVFEGDHAVVRLGDSLNSMLDQIETAFADKEASEDRLKRFVSDASHELRTPLTTIQGYSEIYLSGVATDEENVTKQMTRINAEARRMGGLVQNLLTLARLDQGRGLDELPVDLHQVVVDAISDARAVEPDRDITMVGSLTGEAIVIGDQDALRQVVANLLANTREHAPGSAVEVRLEATAEMATVTVRDHGPGIPPDVAGHIFDRFFQAEQSRHRNDGGAGLGLSIVASIVAAHGGTASVRTEVGVGSTFLVRVPVARIPLPPSRSENGPDPSKSSSNWRAAPIGEH